MEDVQRRLNDLEAQLWQANAQIAAAALNAPADDAADDEADERFQAQDELIGQLQNQLNVMRERTEPAPIKTPANSIHTFHGRADEDFKSWWELFELAALGNGWEEEKKLHMLPAMLRDTALDVYRDLPVATKNDYDLLTQALENALQPADYARFQSVHFHQRRQRVGESVVDYGTSLKKLLRNAYPDWDNDTRNQVLRDRFIDGLEPALKGLVLLNNPATFDDALAEGRRHEAQRYYLAGYAPGYQVPMAGATSTHPVNPIQTALSSVNPMSYQSTYQLPSVKRPSNGDTQGLQRLVRATLNAVQQIPQRITAAQTSARPASMGNRENLSINQPFRELWTTDGKPICSFCTRPGHIRRECLQLRRLMGQNTAAGQTRPWTSQYNPLSQPPMAKAPVAQASYSRAPQRRGGHSRSTPRTRAAPRMGATPRTGTFRQQTGRAAFSVQADATQGEEEDPEGDPEVDNEHEALEAHIGVLQEQLLHMQQQQDGNGYVSVIRTIPKQVRRPPVEEQSTGTLFKFSLTPLPTLPKEELPPKGVEHCTSQEGSLKGQDGQPRDQMDPAQARKAHRKARKAQGIARKAIHRPGKWKEVKDVMSKMTSHQPLMRLVMDLRVHSTAPNTLVPLQGTKGLYIIA